MSPVPIDQIQMIPTKLDPPVIKVPA